MVEKKQIRGPTSALTDFLSEQGIVASELRRNKVDDECLILKESSETGQRKKFKRIRLQEPVEIVNRYKYHGSLEEKVGEHIYCKYEEYKMSTRHLQLFDKYITKKRLLNKKLFDFIVQSSNDEIVISDCSSIKEFNIYKEFKCVELHLCGQMKEEDLSTLLKSSKNLKRLILTGLFNIEGFTVSKSVERLNITSCSRLTDRFIENLGPLEELNISKCYTFTPSLILNHPVKELIAEETLISDVFFSKVGLQSLKRLNLNRCPNITEGLDLSSLENIEELHLEGMSFIQSLKVGKALTTLNISSCFNIKSLDFLSGCTNLQVLNISHLDLQVETLQLLYTLNDLVSLNISWIVSVDDELLIGLCEKLINLKKIEVFGCFNLTEDIGKMAWEKYGMVDIVGNPSETRYLLNN